MMVKQAAKKTSEKKTGIEKLKAEQPDLKGNELKATAYAKCQESLVKLYRKNKDDLDRIEAVKKELANLENKVNKVNTAEAETIAEWLTDYADLKSLITTDSMRSDLQRRASQSLSNGSKGGRAKWDNPALIAALQGVELDEAGMAAFAPILSKAFNAQSIDILTKRLKVVTGELVSVRKDKADVLAKLDDDHKVIKEKGVRSGYKLNVGKVIARLSN